MDTRDSDTTVSNVVAPINGPLSTAAPLWKNHHDAKDSLYGAKYVRHILGRGKSVHG